MVTKRNLGKLIRFFRKKKGLSLEALAKKVLKSQSGLTEIENGKRFPRLELLIDICNELGVNIAVVFYYLDDKEEVEYLDKEMLSISNLRLESRINEKDEKIELLEREINRLKAEIYDIQNQGKIQK